MERKVTTSGDLFHNKTLANALFKPSFLFPPMWKAPYGAFKLEIKSMLNENIGGIMGASQC